MFELLVARAVDTKSSNITLVKTSKLLQVTTSKRKATLTTYFLVKTQNSVQQANSLTRIKHATYRKFNLKIKSSRKAKAKLNRPAAKKKKKNNSQLKEISMQSPMRSSSSCGACFSPTQQSKRGSDLLLQQRKQNKPRKVKSKTLQAKHITHEVIKI